MNILEEANKIVNERSQEKERQYGDFSECMNITTDLFNMMTGNKYSLKPEDSYKLLIALKLAREVHSHKEDNLLDAAAYIGAMNNYLLNKNGK